MKRTKVRITEVKIKYSEKYGTLRDLEGNKLITAPISYIKNAIRTRNYKLVKGE